VTEELNPEPGLLCPPVVLGIAGCSGSGKSTLAAELARLLGGVHFHLDNYYRDLGHLPFNERIQKNFDDPAMIESELLVEHVRQMALGQSIERPFYDFASHTRMVGQTDTITPGRLVVVEGLFALYWANLLPVYHLRVFMQTADTLCYERRLRRDMEERGRSAESVRFQYETTVRPSAVHFVQPTSASADLKIDGADQLDWKVERVLAELKQRGLLSRMQHTL